ncbi:hypothetical protein GCM10011409_45340 [Lentibacillus populi]|uniref:Replication protein n=1 Tax=Lentibacillus populi TaxID=1827502 RepID=A0A9W5U220_9BACI|nr:hypothetical protein [Lentibacillus populi]GGB63183.1 hypothetical protein GCM10011409_45340 [Lentibacillus populi]
MNLFDLLRSDGSIVVNKALAHEIGLNEAIIYSELVSMQEYWRKQGKLKQDSYANDTWFYCTVENLEKNTTLKQKTQQRAIKRLETLGLIKVKMLGVPAKRHFYITDKIYELILQKTRYNQGGQFDHSSMDKMTAQGWTKNPTNNTKDNTNLLKNNKYNDRQRKEILRYNWIENE